MPKLLDDILRDLAKRGLLTHLSLYPNGREWRASYAPATGGIIYNTAPDPAEAVRGALLGTPPTRTTIRTEKPNAKPADIDFDSPDDADDMDFG